MKKTIFLVMLLATASLTIHAQKFLTRNGKITFYSHTPVEDIKSENNEVASVFNTATGELEFKVAIKSFRFKLAAMEEHFNDANYMESDKYPKAGFKGKIVNLSAVNFTKDGTYNVTVKGDLTIKDVTKPVVAEGTVTVSGGKIKAVSTFNIKRKDFNVIGQSFAQKKIAEDIQLTVDCEYDKL